MTRRNPPAKWVLPDVINPSDRICLQISVPNNRYHIAAFRGALLNLASAYKWSDDADHTALLVAQVWRDVVDNVTICDTNAGPEQPFFWIEDDMPQFRQTDCKLEVQCANGDWETLYDPTDCVKDIIKKVGAPSPGGDIANDTHASDCPVLAGSALYKFPFKVEPGDTVTITGATGGWAASSDPTSTWSCPDGSDYLLGGCIPDSGPDAGSGAPIPDNKLMRLTAYYDGLYYDAYNATIELPTDGVQSELLFLANDASLDDNQGSITFCVDVLHPAPVIIPPEDFSGYDWLIDLRLDTGDYDWLILTAGANGDMPRGFISGLGVSTGANGDEVNFRFNLHLPGGTGYVETIRVDAEAIDGSKPGTHYLRITTQNHDDTTDKSDTSIYVDGPISHGELTYTSTEVPLRTAYETNVNIILHSPYNFTGCKSWATRVRIAGHGTLPAPVHV